MSETTDAFAELNARLLQAHAEGESFEVQVDGRPAFWYSEEAGRYEGYSLLRARPHILGNVAVLGFAGMISPKTDMLHGAHLIGQTELGASTLAFRLANPAPLMRAARYVDMTAEEAKYFYFNPNQKP